MTPAADSIQNDSPGPSLQEENHDRDVDQIMVPAEVISRLSDESQLLLPLVSAIAIPDYSTLTNNNNNNNDMDHDATTPDFASAWRSHSSEEDGIVIVVATTTTRKASISASPPTRCWWMMLLSNILFMIAILWIEFGIFQRKDVTMDTPPTNQPTTSPVDAPSVFQFDYQGTMNGYPIGFYGDGWGRSIEFITTGYLGCQEACRTMQACVFYPQAVHSYELNCICLEHATCASKRGGTFHTDGGRLYSKVPLLGGCAVEA